MREAAQTLEEPTVTLTSGRRLRAPAIVVACGLDANTLLGESWLRAKKGQLAITDRYGPLLRHQLVELGYGAYQTLRGWIKQGKLPDVDGDDEGGEDEPIDESPKSDVPDEVEEDAGEPV